MNSSNAKEEFRINASCAAANPTARILLVDSDPEIRGAVSALLARHRYAVDLASNAVEMDLVLSERVVDLIILDVVLPGDDGLQILRRLARVPSPSVIVLSARGEEFDRILGLELGAADYLAKPCSLRELLARVRAVLRRHQSSDRAEASQVTYCEFDDWRFDLIQRQLMSPQGVVVELAHSEFNLLRVLLERPRQVLTRDRLLDLTRGLTSQAYDRSIDVQVSRLRRKLSDGANWRIIRTVYGGGYVLDAAVHWV